MGSKMIGEFAWVWMLPNTRITLAARSAARKICEQRREAPPENFYRTFSGGAQRRREFFEPIKKVMAKSNSRMSPKLIFHFNKTSNANK